MRGLREVWKEVLIGAGAALLAFLGISGLDVTPFIFFIVILAALWFLLEGRTGRRFEVVGGAESGGGPPPVTFADVGGQEVPKRELMEALEFVREAERVAHLGIRPLKGILLAGPPGTGKTLMAKAAAHYTDSVFLAASGSQFVEMYAGVGAQRVRQLFRQARELARRQGKRSAMVFIDEIEVLGGRRGQHGSHLEYDQTLNQLLVEMDGLTPDDPVRVLVIGATNRPDLLDPALLRPGRFDRIVYVDLPDREGRLHILKIHARGKPLADDVDLEAVARDTYGFSGAHLENLLNEAAILALRAGKDRIGAAEIRDAIDKVMMGEKLDRKPRREELERVACHEMGHALVAELVRPGAVAQVTVTPRGRALGYMRQTPADDQYLYTREELLGQIAVTLGGAVAEELIFGSRSTGSAGDFEQAVQLAERMVLAGLSRLGIVHKDRLPSNVLHDEIQAIVREQEERVRAWLAARQELLVELARRLLVDEKVPGDELRARLAAYTAVGAPAAGMVPGTASPDAAAGTLAPWADAPYGLGPGALMPGAPTPEALTPGALTPGALTPGAAAGWESRAARSSAAAGF
ncbi:MAG TPA: AAA family ATPase [Limnochordales bacterium]